MRKYLLAALLLLPGIASAQFVNGQILTAAQLNSALAALLPITGGTLTGPIVAPSATFTSPLGFASGGTGATSAAGALANLGAGTMATQNASSVSVTGGSIGGLSSANIGGYAYPSVYPAGRYSDFVVPQQGTTYIDNVTSLENNTRSATADGNAAIVLNDRNGDQRGAIGYSHVGKGSPGGYYQDTAYIEIGDLYADDSDPTDFKIVETTEPGGLYFPGTSFIPIEADTATGAAFLRSRGAGLINLQGESTVGAIGSVYPLDVGMTTTLARLREKNSADDFSLSTNLNLADVQDNTALSSWEMDMGAGAGTGGLQDSFSLGRVPAGGTGPTRMFYVDNNGDAVALGNVAAGGSLNHGQEEVDTSYVYSTPATGTAVTLATGKETAIINPAGSLAALTVTLPGCSATYDGSIARYSSTQAITALTVNASYGDIADAPTTLAAGVGHGMLCVGASATWFPLY
jgi:hypothetical protein